MRWWESPCKWQPEENHIFSSRLLKIDPNVLKMVEWPNVLYAPDNLFLNILIFWDFMAKNVQKWRKLAKMACFRDMSSTLTEELKVLVWWEQNPSSHAICSNFLLFYFFWIISVTYFRTRHVCCHTRHTTFLILAQKPANSRTKILNSTKPYFE